MDGGWTPRFRALFSYRIINWHEILRGNSLLNTLFNQTVCAGASQYIKAYKSWLRCKEVCFTNAGSEGESAKPAKEGFKDCQNFQPSHVLIIHLFLLFLRRHDQIPHATLSGPVSISVPLQQLTGTILLINYGRKSQR